jgi:hypothetical protein
VTGRRIETDEYDDRAMNVPGTFMQHGFFTQQVASSDRSSTEPLFQRIWCTLYTDEVG